MKKTIYTIALLMLLVVPGTVAQTTNSDLRIVVDDYAATSSDVTFSVTIDPSSLDISSNTLVVLTPVLRSTDGRQERRFTPVAFAGPIRYRVIGRERIFDEPKFEVGVFVKHRRKDAKVLPLRLEVPFEKWMRHSELVFEETRSGCASCNLSAQVYQGVTPSFPEPYQPTFAVSYIIPEVETIKTRSDSYMANLSFQVGKSILLRDFGNNARQLVEVDKIISELQNDALLSLSSISVQGYASPDGTESSNQKLSEDRARAFVDYITGAHNLRTGNVAINSVGMGEDWTGLRKAVDKAAGLPDRQAIIDAIDNVSDINRRKNAIRALSGGRTYRILLEDYYPPLRRNEYTIDYTVRSFNQQEAIEIYKERPTLLSLNELFMVATSYDPSSEEYKQVFDFASRMYPESTAAQFNTAALEVENGAYQSAVHRMEGFDTPEAWNNLGVAYWHLGEYDKAEEMFRRSADAGFNPARANHEQFQKWSDDRE